MLEYLENLWKPRRQGGLPRNYSGVHLGRAIGGETDTSGENSALDQDRSIDYASCRFGMSIINRVKRKDCCRWTRMVGFSCHKRVETLKSDIEKWPQLSWTRQAFPINDLPDLRRPLIF